MKTKVTMLTLFFLIALSSVAMAAGVSDVASGILGNANFKTGITIGFALLAGYRWLMYFAGFKPDAALSEAVVPAMLTLMTFQWTTIIGWFIR